MAGGADPAGLAKRGYAICTAPRSGSNFLCQLLASTASLGRPMEYFNGQGLRHFQDPSYPEDPVGQAERILATGATPNGVYGLKIFAHQHDSIAGQLRWTEVLPGLRFVFLTRRDLLAQAISLTRANQTGQFWHGQPATAQPQFDAARIAESLTTIVTEYARWEAYFARNGIEPVRLLYEKLVAEPQAAVDRVAALFDLTGGATADPRLVEVAIQSDELTSEWRRRFLAEQRNEDFVDRL